MRLLFNWCTQCNGRVSVAVASMTVVCGQRNGEGKDSGAASRAGELVVQTSLALGDRKCNRWDKHTAPAVQVSAFTFLVCNKLDLSSQWITKQASKATPREIFSGYLLF